MHTGNIIVHVHIHMYMYYSHVSFLILVSVFVCNRLATKGKLPATGWVWVTMI